eukprot:1026696-Pyramimonas_sp.AAC.1
MLEEAAKNWRESRSGGRRSGWGNIGHAGFKHSFAANRRRLRFEFPDGMPAGQQRDPRPGAPDYRPPPLPETTFVPMRSISVTASPA